MVGFEKLVCGAKVALAGALMAAMLAPGVASAQFTKSYQFLEHVRKKEGQDVIDALSDPARSTIVNTRDVSTGETALHIVTARRDATWMGFLLAKGADPNIRDNHGDTPLVVAANLGFVEGVDALIANGARVDEPNSTGETPLITAVHRRDIAVMRSLLKAGANPDRADSSGRTARDYARLDKGSNLADELEQAAKARAASKKSYGPSL